MKTLSRSGYLFFIATYVFLGLWLYKGITATYHFCLAGNSSVNILGLLCGLSALLTVPFYVNHQRSSIKSFGYFTLCLGIAVLLIVIYRFVSVTPVCLQ
jgi:hypothetical protein